MMAVRDIPGVQVEQDRTRGFCIATREEGIVGDDVERRKGVCWRKARGLQQ